METLTTQSLLETAQSLIGKTIIADGWQRDNGGMISGKITEIKKGRFGDLEYIIHVERTTELSMNEMTFKKQHLETLLADGKLPEANRLLNSGTNAKIIG